MSTYNLPPGVTTADIERAQGLEEVSDLCPHDRPWTEPCAKCEEDNHEPLCPKCHSTDLQHVSGDFPTGVKFDMWEETVHEEFYVCEDCGCKFEESEAD